MLIDTIVVGAFQENCYIVADEETRDAVVIDPGDEPEKILSNIARHDISVKYILLTHAHLDHIMGVRLVKETLNPELLMHQADSFLYDNLVEQAAQYGFQAAPPLPVDRYFNEGDHITLGHLDIEIIHTPGHSPGGVSLVLPGHPTVVFGGDTLFSQSIGRTDLPGGSYDTLLNAIRDKLLTMDTDTIIYPGHGPQTTIGFEKEHNPFLV
jgi:glyoxylase-like metal-dependent hydrolase (beta-lactamase superfamily II)